MSQSLSQLYIHLTFSTKHRFPFINEKWNKELHAYMSGILKNNDSPALIINSVADHCHVLFRLSKNYTLAKVVEHLKKDSSKWVKANTDCKKFSWQGGYGAFSVSASKLDTVRNYILNQQEHHRKVSFREEVEEFMKQYGVVEYDARYFWE